MKLFSNSMTPAAFAVLFATGARAGAFLDPMHAQQVAGAVCQLATLLRWPADEPGIGPPVASLSAHTGPTIEERAELRIAILGVDDAASLLEEAARDRTAHGAPLRVLRFEDSADVEGDLVYVARSEASHVEHVLDVLAAKESLTIGAFPEFLTAGGTIEVRAGGTMDVRVNRDALHALGVVLDAPRSRNTNNEDDEREASCGDE